MLGLGDEMKMCPLGDLISTLAKLRACVYSGVGVSKARMDNSALKPKHGLKVIVVVVLELLA